MFKAFLPYALFTLAMFAIPAAATYASHLGVPSIAVMLVSILLSFLAYDLCGALNKRINGK